MATTRTYRTTIEFYGLEVEVDVEYTIHNWGNPGNGWDEPPEGADFEIDSVTSTLTGRDLRQLCETYYTGKIHIVSEWRQTGLCEQPRDRVQTAIFGTYRSTGVAPLSLEHREDTRRTFHWYGIGLRETGQTLLDLLYEQIADHGDALEPPESGYDSYI